MPVFEPNPRSKVRRLAERASYDSAAIYPILDAALVCHVAFVVEGQPFSIPTLHARIGDTVLLHGSPGSRLIRHLQAGNEVCISVALVDGLVAAKSVFHHSINYRSAVVFGRGRKVEGPEELLKGLEAFTEKILPGRWSEARTPNPEELRATGMAAVDIVSASAKTRSGGPVDDPIDLDLAVWNGVIPLRQVSGSLESGSSLPASPSVEAFLKLFKKE